METEKKNNIQLENEVVTNEAILSSKADTRNSYSHQVSATPLVKKKPDFSLRIKKFFVRKQSKRMMEFGAHPKGIHWLNNAIVHSENGCLFCKMDLEEE